MVKWSLFAEFLSLAILSLMFLYYHEKNIVVSFRRRLFNWIFGLAVLSIILNILCVYTISNAARIPHWLNLCLNTAYFILIVGVCSIIALYIFMLMLEHIDSKIYFRRLVWTLVILNTAYIVVALSNVHTGVLFHFTRDGRYVRGPLNSLGYWVMGIELVMILICYIHHREMIPPRVRQVIRTIPPVAVVLTAFQLFYPEILFNGMIITVAVFILYSNFQTYTVEKDYLTQLGNRKAFFDDVQAMIKRGQSFQVIAVSLKHFYEINQKYDHAFGDDLLFVIGKWLEKFSKNSRAYRFVNVSFAIVLPYTDEISASRNVSSIYDRFGEAWRCKDVFCKVAACTCELIWNGQAWGANTIIEYLETMTGMSRSIHNERIRFNQEVIGQIEWAKNLEAIMRTSLKEDRFSIVLQPLYDCGAGEFSSGEALVRLNDFDGNAIPTGEFIDIAEKTGLLDDISWVVLDKVCAFLGENRELPLKSVSINLSLQQFLNPSLLTRINENLERFGIPRGKLKIEITERVIFQELSYVRKVMSKLVEKGVGFYLDDFGTGYSNFSVLMSLPFEYVKLDKCLFSQLMDKAGDGRMIGNLISLFHDSGLQVVCEGIETKKQAEVARELGTDKIQGFFYAKPMRVDAFRRFILERHNAAS